MQITLRGNEKVFVIGLNKTGTTTLEYELRSLGYRVGNQTKAELLLQKIMVGSTKEIMDYCKEYEAFQDIPFSIPGFYKNLDEHFPNSKYILSIRDNEDEWYNSLVNFHSKLWGNGYIPSEDALKNVSYIYTGYVYTAIKYIFGPKIYDEKHYKNVYIQHIQEAKKFFASKPHQLLILNLKSKDSYLRFCEFLNVQPQKSHFSQKNVTSEIV